MSSTDALIQTPSKRWRLYLRANGSHYAISPYGTQVEIADAGQVTFFACAAGLGMLPNELARVCDLAPVTEPVPASAPSGP
jgi:hypothetical protein